jgi:O-antigen/teichoic acid export membrane protein
MFLAPLSFMLPAVLSKYYDENNMDEVKKILRYSLKYFLLLAIPATFGLSLLSKSILTILTTPEIALQGYLITPFIAVSAVLFGVRLVMGQGLYLAKRTDISGKIWIIAAILNLGLNFVVVPYIGIVGAAITTLIAFTLSAILATYYSFKYLIFDINFSFIAKSVFASFIISLVIIKLNPVGILNVLVVIGICAVVYSAILLLLKGVKKEEIKFFRGLFNI